MLDTIASVHWMSITIWPQVRADTDTLLSILGLQTFQKTNFGGRGYRYISLGQYGAKLYSYPWDLKHGDHVHLELPGSACEVIEPAHIKELFRWLNKLGLKYHLTRLDVALDTDRFEVSDVADAVSYGNVKTRVHRKNIERYQALDGSGDTLYFGHKQSSTRLRVYKRFDEHSPIFFDVYTRVELQLRDERSQHMFSLLAAADFELWASLMGAAINQFVTILLPFWSSWLGDGLPQGVLLKVTIPPKTLKKTVDWLYSQVAPSLAMFLQAVTGGDVDKMQAELTALLHQGLDRMSQLHHRIVFDTWAGGIEQVYSNIHPEPDAESTKYLREQFRKNFKPSWFNNIMEKWAFAYPDARPQDFQWYKFGWEYVPDRKYRQYLDVIEVPSSGNDGLFPLME